MGVYADVVDGTCINVIVAEASFIPIYAVAMPNNQLVLIDGIDPTPGVGWTYDGTTWTPPPEVSTSDA